MGQFRALIDMLSDQELESVTARNMGELGLDEVVALLRSARLDLESAESLDENQIPSSARNEILGGSFHDRLNALLAGMREYGPQTDNPAAARGRFLVDARFLKDQVLERVIPYVRVSEAEVQRALVDAERFVADLERTRAEVDKQIQALAQSSASTAASDLSGFYRQQANKHETAAKRFFWAAVASAGLLTVLTVWFLFVSPPEYDADQTSQQWIEVARHTVARLALLSIAGFAVAFCVRNYRVNMHLEVLNKRRENALNTFGLMQASVTSDDARNIVVGELVRAVFMSEETGYLSIQADRTIIESPGAAGMFSAVSAASKGPAT